VWIVNLQNQTIEQYRAPSASEYARSQIFRRGEMITIEKFPEVSFAVEELIA
jgi:Uma2 family endonuclease